MQYVTKGSITGVLGVLATIAGILGYSPLKVFFSDPTVADSLFSAIGLVASFASSFMQGKKPA